MDTACDRRASDARSENPKETPPGLGLRMPIIRGGGMGVVDVGTGGLERVRVREKERDVGKRREIGKKGEKEREEREREKERERPRKFVDN